MVALRLDVWSDVSCPWCWIGHARLCQALQHQEPDSVEIVPRAFELTPTLPAGGLAAETFLAERLGSPDRVRAHFTRVTREGAAEDVHFRFDLMTRAPNTRMAHRLVKIADREGHGTGALDALFSAHFREGLDVGDPGQACGAVARSTGLDAADLRRAVQDGVGEAEVAADLDAALEVGASGVPFFVAGGTVAAQGAQPVAELVRLLDTARQRAA